MLDENPASQRRIVCAVSRTAMTRGRAVPLRSQRNRFRRAAHLTASARWTLTMETPRSVAQRPGCDCFGCREFGEEMDAPADSLTHKFGLLL